jgi:hypothetical protein
MCYFEGHGGYGKDFGGVAKFSPGFSCSDMVMECGQTEALETMELLKELPADVYHELLLAFMHSLLQ